MPSSRMAQQKVTLSMRAGTHGLVADGSQSYSSVLRKQSGRETFARLACFQYGHDTLPTLPARAALTRPSSAALVILAYVSRTTWARRTQVPCASREKHGKAMILQEAFRRGRWRGRRGHECTSSRLVFHGGAGATTSFILHACTAPSMRRPRHCGAALGGDTWPLEEGCLFLIPTSHLGNSYNRMLLQIRRGVESDS